MDEQLTSGHTARRVLVLRNTPWRTVEVFNQRGRLVHWLVRRVRDGKREWLVKPNGRTTRFKTKDAANEAAMLANANRTADNEA